jgi:membrane protein YqaA with SNARE-associated domain
MELLRDLLHGMRERMTWLLHWVESLAASPSGEWALFVIAFAESSVFPIPPDALLIPLCLGDPSRAFEFATVCTFGSVLGGTFGYGLGHWGGRPLLKRLFNPVRVAAVAGYYERYNAWATGIAGLTPVPYKLFTVSAGALGVNFRVFVLASVASRGARFFAVAALLYFYGETARRLIEEHFNWLAVAFVILLILGFWAVGRGARRAAGPPADPSA